MELLTRDGQREWSFSLVLDKVLKGADARGSREGGGRGRALRPGRYAGFAQDPLHISARPTWKRIAAEEVIANPSRLVLRNSSPAC